MQYSSVIMSKFPFETRWLHNALKFSLQATLSYKSSSISPAIADGPGPPEERDPRFRKLIEGILYSRGFVPTYHFVIASFIAVVAVKFWSEKAIRWRRVRIRNLHGITDGRIYDEDALVSEQRIETYSYPIIEVASSSGSSTLEGTESPPLKIQDEGERTPLLYMKRPELSRTPQRTLWTYIKAFLMYQPPQTPIEHRTQPSLGTSIIISVFVALNLFYTLYHINFEIMELFILADRCGLVFIVNLPLLYLASAKTQPLKILTGYSYESLNIFHRRLGEVLCLEALFHSVGMAGVWYTLLRPTGFTLLRFIFNKVIITGILAFVAYELIFFTARPFFRQLCYELFLGLHVFLQTAALLLLWFHHPSSRVYVGIALGIFIIDRLLYRVIAKATTIIADAQVMEDGETVRLTGTIVLRPKDAINRIVGTVTGGWQAADHVFITIPALGRKHIIQAHPFTISCRAPTSDEMEAKVEFLIRAQNGFSLDLLRVAAQHDSLRVRIDGPYGTDHARSLLADAEVAIVVAGGSGIAVAWPLINFLLDRSRSTDAKIASESQLRGQKIILIWIVHRSAHLSWIGRHDLQSIDDKGVEVVILQATEEAGRPDLEGIIDDVVMKTSPGRRIGVVGSGPDSMGRTVRNTCAKLVMNGRDVGVTIEKFGW
jgi:hypothetical protein